MRHYLLLLFALLLSLNSLAYDAFGHRVIADIAYAHLTKKARKQVNATLGDRGIVYASAWADEIRSDSAYSYSYQWHFQNLKDGLTTAEIQTLWENPKLEGLHLFYALDSLTKELKKERTNQETLRFIVHFMGDCMQPMHLGRAEDLGGNRVSITWFGRNTNIHTLWDRYLFESRQYSYSEYSRYLQDKYKGEKRFARMTLLESIQRCYQIREKIYAYHESGKSNNYHYLFHFNPYLDECVYMAGIQLAHLLNTVYR